MSENKYFEEATPQGVVNSYIDDDYMVMNSTKATDDTRWSRPKTGYFDDRVSEHVGSYLDTHEKDNQRNKVTKSTDATKFGSVKEVYDDSKVNTYGQSYLDTHERDAQRNKVTKITDATRFGSQKEFYNDRVEEHGMSYLQKMEQHKQEQLKRESELRQQSLAKFANKYLDPEEHMFPYNELKGKNCPQGVDPTIKELYLSDEEFEKVFKMDYDQFCALPKFKRTQLKKQVDLF
jgi:hypothetical protein